MVAGRPEIWPEILQTICHTVSSKVTGVCQAMIYLFEVQRPGSKDSPIAWTLEANTDIDLMKHGMTCEPHFSGRPAREKTRLINAPVDQIPARNCRLNATW